MNLNFPARAFRFAAAGWALLLGAGSFARSPRPVFTPFHPDGIYALGETVGWTVTERAGRKADPVGYTYTVKEDNFTVIATGRLDLSSGRATMETRCKRPAMLYVTVRRADAGHGTCDAAPVATLGAAVDPTGLRPSAPCPSDFDAFWAGKLASLKRVPIHPILTPLPAGPAGVRLYRVRLDSLGSHVQGYLAFPRAGGKLPALVIYQWAGVYALNPSAAADRAADGWLAFDVDAHDLPPDQGTGVPANYNAIGDTSRETSYFLGMYLRDTRAIDYISTCPRWDGKTIVLTGTSMGGQQSLATAGLNPGRITAVIVDEPSGADSNGALHGRQAGYPFWDSRDPRVMRTARYFDTVNFAPHITAPALIAMGFIDTTAPPAGVWTVINRIPGAKEAVPMIDSDHNNITPQAQAAYYQRSEQVLATLLVGRPFHPDQSLTRPKG
ncbi:MAG: acetylxylan esterase [Opitutaceae bacterium]